MATCIRWGLCRRLNKTGLFVVQRQAWRSLSTSIYEPVIYDKKPAKVEVVEGKIYTWCACGRSKKQPFCDGSHTVHPDTGVKLPTPYPITPIKYTAVKTCTVYFCNCKQSSKAPLCDGTHKTL